MNLDYFVELDKQSIPQNIDSFTIRYHRLIAEGKKKEADKLRSEWNKNLPPVQMLETAEMWKMISSSTIDLNDLPYASWFLQFTFTLAKPYISKDDNPFYIIDNPIVRDKVFRLPMVRSTAWKGNLYSALWQLGHDKTQNDEQMQRLFGEIRDQEDGQAGRLFFYPTFFTQTSLEIINPHDRKRRVGINPILFESVPAGASGTFTLLYIPFDLIGQVEAEIRKQALADLQLVAEGLKEMFLTYGFSAKRSSGYGVAEDRVDNGKLTLNIQGVEFSQAEMSHLPEPKEAFHKYLDESGQVKSTFKGSGVGGLMSNNEYKQSSAGAVGGSSLSEFKNFRNWYLKYGKAWQAHLKRGATPSHYSTISFESLSSLITLCQNLESTFTGGEA